LDLLDQARIRPAPLEKKGGNGGMLRTVGIPAFGSKTGVGKKEGRFAIVKYRERLQLMQLLRGRKLVKGL